MSELLLGCGRSRDKRLTFDGVEKEWSGLVTLDNDPAVSPDVLHDLDVLPYPFDDNTFDEIHAYEVLEHCGKQGDWRGFFAQFSELHRILTPGGLLVASVPMWNSPWAWGDPGHTRVITQGSLAFLSQKVYAQEIGKTTLTDYRHVYKADFDAVAFHDTEHTFGFILKAIK
jgi:SAM-dependent methyltransferase